MDERYPLITILTDTKNRSSLISRCIESIQRQTYQNYEHIIADGGDDDTEEVVKSYNDPRIKYVKVPVGGPYVQTKTAFGMSSGDYITFLDDDDEYMPEKLEKQLELMLSLPLEYGFIYGSMSYYDNDSQKYLYDHKATYEGGSELLPIAVSGSYVCGTPSFMFRRDVFESIGATWIPGIGNERSDWALACKALKEGWKVAALKDSYLRIYVNHSAVRMSDDKFYEDHCKRYVKFHNYFLTEYADVFKEHPLSAVLHYECLMYYNILLGEDKVARDIWFKLIKTRFNIRSISLFPYYKFRKCFR